MRLISQRELWQARRETAQSTKGWRARRRALAELSDLWMNEPYRDLDLSVDFAPSVLDIRAIRALCDTLLGVFPPMRRVSLRMSEALRLLSPDLQESEVRILRQTLCRASLAVLSIDLEPGELDGWGLGDWMLPLGQRVLTMYFYMDNLEED